MTSLRRALRASAAAIVLMAVATSCAGSDAGSSDSHRPGVTSPATTRGTVGACPDPDQAADHVLSALPDYDYQGAASPRQLAESAGTVVVGRVGDATAAAGRIRLELTEVETVYGTTVGMEHSVAIDAGFDLAAFDPDRLVGLDVLAFLFEGTYATVEGLWFGCGQDRPASPAMLEPTRDGWPEAPTIEALVHLLVEPPRLVDGPVVRRSGVRELAAHGAVIPDRVRTRGRVLLEESCLVLETDHRRVPVIWPAHTTWDPDDQIVVLDDGTVVALDDERSFDGRYHGSHLVRFDFGDEAADSTDRCSAEPFGSVLLVTNVR